MKKVIAAILIMLSIGVIGYIYIKPSKSSEVNKYKSPLSIDKVPDFKCSDINGNEITNDLFKGNKLTMLNIWGTYCYPCIQQLNDLQEIYNKTKDKEVNIIGIVSDGIENKPTALRILKINNITFINIIPNEKFTNEFLNKLPGIPVSLFVNENGEIVGKIIIGAKDKDYYKEIIQRTLKHLK